MGSPPGPLLNRSRKQRKRKAPARGHWGLGEYNAKASSGGQRRSLNELLRIRRGRAFGSLNGADKRKPRPGREDRGFAAQYDA